MPENHLYEAISDITKYALMSGDEIQNSLNYEGPDGNRRLGIAVIRDNLQIDIHAASHEGALTCFYVLSLTDSAVASIDDEEAMESVGSDISELSMPEIKRGIASKRVLSLDISADDFADQLTPDYESNIQHYFSEGSRGDEYWDGFQCFERMYAFDDSFRAKDYDDRMRRFTAEIRKLTQVVDNLLPEDSLITSSKDAQSDTTVEGRRGFQ